MTPLVWFVNSPKFQKLLHDEFPPEMQFFFNLEQNSVLTLLLPLPIYHLTEQMGAQPIPKDVVNYIIAKMNEH